MQQTSEMDYGYKSQFIKGASHHNNRLAIAKSLLKYYLKKKIRKTIIDRYDGCSGLTHIISFHVLFSFIYFKL